MKKIIIYLLLAFSFSSITVTAQSKKNKENILSSENGRYVFGQVSEYRADQFLLDTKTGRLWQIKLVDSASTNIKVLEQIPFILLNGSRSLVPFDPSEEINSYYEDKGKDSKLDTK